MQIQAVLFDLDGTLVNTLRIFPQLIAEELSHKKDARAIKRYLKRLGTFYNQKKNNEWYRHSWLSIDFFRGIKNDFRISWIKLFSVLIRVTWKFFLWDRSYHIFPEVPETLDYLKTRGFKLGVVSNGSSKQLKKRFEPLLDRFDVLIDSKSIGYKKPSPYPLLLALKRLNLSRKEVIFVGDTLVDILAARNADIPIVIVESGVFGLPLLEEMDYKPIAIIPVVGRDLIEVIKKIEEGN
ncbi:MAG: HAD family hydrolase [Candidatus Hodarchaeales archaeon]